MSDCAPAGADTAAVDSVGSRADFSGNDRHGVHVDWIGASAAPGATWWDFTATFGAFYAWAAPTGKPLLAWAAVLEDPLEPQWKADRMTGVSTTLQTTMPAVKASVYYHALSPGVTSSGLTPPHRRSPRTKQWGACPTSIPALAPAPRLRGLLVVDRHAARGSGDALPPTKRDAQRDINVWGWKRLPSQITTPEPDLDASRRPARNDRGLLFVVMDAEQDRQGAKTRGL